MACVLVVRAGQTDRAAAQRAHHLLANVGARIVGTVLNDPGGEVSQYGDYHYPYDYAVEHEVAAACQAFKQIPAVSHAGILLCR